MTSKQHFNELDIKGVENLNYEEIYLYIEYLKTQLDTVEAETVHKVEESKYLSLEEDYTDLTNSIDDAHKQLTQLDHETGYNFSETIDQIKTILEY